VILLRFRHSNPTDANQAYMSFAQIAKKLNITIYRAKIAIVEHFKSYMLGGERVKPPSKRIKNVELAAQKRFGQLK